MYTFKVRQKRDNKVKIAREAKLLERKIKHSYGELIFYENELFLL